MVHRILCVQLGFKTVVGNLRYLKFKFGLDQEQGIEVDR